MSKLKRVDELIDAITNLSYQERAELRRRCGWDRSISFIKVIKEGERVARSPEWYREVDIDEKDIAQEFFLYYARPEWLEQGGVDAERPAVLEIIDDGILTLRLSYYRDDLIDLLICVGLAKHYLRSIGSVTDDGWDATFESTERRERVVNESDSADYERVRTDYYIRYSKEGSEDVLEPLRDFVDRLIEVERNTEGWSEYFADMREWVIKAETLFASSVEPELMGVMSGLISEINEFLNSPDGVVPSEKYKRLSFRSCKLISPQGRGRPATLDPHKREQRLKEFVISTNKLKGLANHIRKFLRNPNNRLRDDWESVLEGDLEFQDLCEGHDIEIVMEVARLTAVRYKNRRIEGRKGNLNAMPLTIAREIAARELKLTQENGLWYDPESLDDLYREGGGFKWTYRPIKPVE